MKFRWSFQIFLLFFANRVISQAITVELGNPNIALNEAFTITLEGRNEKISTYDKFPEIPGMIKRGTSSSASTNIVNGQMTFTQSTTQNYMASREGKYILRPFSMTVNGMVIKSQGATINVGPPRQAQRSPFDFDPFEDFFGKSDEPKEFVDVKADAFFGLITNKDEVYVGEGVTATLAFYVSAQNRAEMEFYDLGNQLNEILKKVKPSNCWEENFAIEQIEKEPIVINNKSYTQYKLYQGVFYPLNVQDIVFPSVDLKMIKYKVARRQSFFGDNRQEQLQIFSTHKKVVKVKDLPPHPLKDKVAVGNYKLDETASTLSIATGTSFNYIFKLVGEGNIAGLTGPEIPHRRELEFYSPNIKQNINRAGNRVSGSKSFNYQAIPNEPGEYRLKDYFSWVFFNTIKKKYDTLQSALTLKVMGESRTNSAISSNDMGAFYDQVDVVDNTLISREKNNWTEWFVNIFMVVMIIITLVIIIKK